MPPSGTRITHLSSAHCLKMWTSYMLLPVCALGGLTVISLDSQDAWTIRNVTAGHENHTGKSFKAPVPGTIPGALFAAGVLLVDMFACVHLLVLNSILSPCSFGTTPSKYTPVQRMSHARHATHRIMYARLKPKIHSILRIFHINIKI